MVTCFSARFAASSEQECIGRLMQHGLPGPGVRWGAWDPHQQFEECHVRERACGCEQAGKKKQVKLSIQDTTRARRTSLLTWSTHHVNNKSGTSSCDSKTACLKTEAGVWSIAKWTRNCCFDKDKSSTQGFRILQARQGEWRNNLLCGYTARF